MRTKKGLSRIEAGRCLYVHTQFLRAVVVLAVHKDVEDKRRYFGSRQHVEQKGVSVCPLCKHPISSYLYEICLIDSHRSSP